MKKAIAFLAVFSLSIALYSQTPGVRWTQTLGGNGYDYYYFTQRSIDGGIISIGRAQSTSQHFDSNPNPGYLYVEKFNTEGISQWKGFYSEATIFQDPVAFTYNPDGSIVILCRSQSGNPGQAPTHGLAEISVFKIDNNGNQLWHKYFGGSGNDFAGHIIKCATGGYVIAGGTMNDGGQVSGYEPGQVTEYKGGVDAWVIKIDESGNLIWQKVLGGSGDDGRVNDPGGFRQDRFRGKLAESTDGSIYLLTETTSNDGDVTGVHVGSRDLWLVKLNSNGLIQWGKCLGGNDHETLSDISLTSLGEICTLGITHSPELNTHGVGQDDIYFTRVSPLGDILFQKCFGSTGDDQAAQIVEIQNDNTCVIAGQVSKGDGDVTGYHGSSGNVDIWIFKIDQTGNIIWQRALGGSSNDQMIGKYMDGAREAEPASGGVIKTKEGGYFLSAWTESNNNGDISGFHPHASNDPTGADLWVVKLTANGNLEWSKCIGGSIGELPKGLPIEINPNDYGIGAYTNSNDGDVYNFYGNGDPWLVRVAPFNKIMGKVFVDFNGNGIKNSGEPLFSYATIHVTKRGVTKEVVPLDGQFYAETDTGVYTTTLVLDHPYYTVAPTQHTSTFTSYFNTDAFDFALQPIAGIKDLVIDVCPITPARPGFVLEYEIHYRNAGHATVTTGQVLFKKDSRLNFVSASPSVSATVGDTLKWNYSNLAPCESRTIRLKLRLAPPPVVNIGNTITSVAIINPVTGDVTPQDDTAWIKQIVQGSYDPNDKAENVGNITLAQIAAGHYINYLIRFQNTGNDQAFNITVKDTLDAKLDWSTFEMVDASHAYQLEINNSNQIAWTFSNIDLPDSNVNEPESHGFIAYRIKPLANVHEGEIIHNTASIYFDFNLPVLTNETSTLVGALNISLPLHLLAFDANYRKPDALLEWSTAEESNVDKFIIERGTDPVHFVPIGTIGAKGGNILNLYQFKDGLANTSGDKFFYRLKMMDLDQKFTYSNIQVVKREGRVINELVMNPNPVKGRTGYAYINFEKAITVNLNVVDMQGRTVYISQQKISKGYNVIPLDFSILKNGTYFLHVKAEGKQMVSPFVLIQ